MLHKMKNLINKLTLLMFISVNCYADNWECFDNSDYHEFYRFKVINGWLIKSHVYNGEAITFIPDVDHKWIIIKCA